MSDDDFLKCSCKECGNHIEFPVQSAGTVVTCPHCGQWTELAQAEPEAPKAARKVLILGGAIGLVAVIVAVAGYFYLRNPAKTASPAPPAKIVAGPTNPVPTNATPVKPTVPAKPEKSLDDFKVGSVELEKAKVGSLVYAVGTVSNASEFQRFGVQIELEVLNKDGKKIGLAKDYKDVIEPNHQWHFHALIHDSKATSAKMLSLKEE